MSHHRVEVIGEEDFEFSLADAVSVVMEMIDDVADAMSFIASEVDPEVRP